MLRRKQLAFKLFVNQKPLQNYFCQNKIITEKQNKPKLGLLKQKADLALQIYHLILQKPTNLNLHVKSLQEMIMETIDKNRIYLKQLNQNKKADEETSSEKKKLEENKTKDEIQKDEEAIKLFIEMFDKGLLINEDIFSQIRIKEAQIESGYKLKLVFHPTYLITSKVFNELHQTLNQSNIFKGQSGISKTVSVCLFWNLVKVIDQYRFRQNAQVSEKMMRVPKLVYWSINKDRPNPKPLIINQCQEIIQNLPYKNGDLYDWKVSIKQFYSKYFPQQSDFNVIFVIDQIDYAASLGKKYKVLIEDIIKNKKQIPEINYLSSNRDFQIASFFKIKKEIFFFIKQFNGIVGLSSMNIQNLFFQQISMTLDNNEKILPMINIEYSNKFFENSSLLQIVDYFIFEIDQRIFKNFKAKKIFEEDKKRMKSKCFDFLQQKLKENNYFFFTPLDIRKEFTKPENKIKQLGTILDEKVVNFFKNIVDNSTGVYKDLIANHFKKIDNLDQKRIELMFSVYRSLTQKTDNQRYTLYRQQISYIPIEGLSFNSEQINDLIDKKLFQYNGGRYLQLMLPFQLIKQVFNLQILDKLNLYSKYLLRYHNQINDIASLERTTKNLFILALNKGNIKFSLNLKNEKAYKRNSKYQFDVEREIYKFKHLQKRYENGKPIEILSRFKKQIKLMRENQKKCAVLFPVSNENSIKKQQSFDSKLIVSNSKLIDLVFIENIKRSDFVSIWLIDVTVSKDQIIQKIQAFIEQFISLADKNTVTLSDVQQNLKIEINYFVFGPRHYLKSLDFSKLLQDRFSKEITFNTLDESNVFTVKKLKNSKNCLLKRVGFIDIGNDFKFANNLQNEEYIQVFKSLLKKAEDFQ